MFLRRLSRTEQFGFTILELLVSTSVFTIVLLIVAVGAVSFTNSYYKGIASSKTQAATRSIIAEVAQSIQFGKSIVPLTGAGGVRGVCIDNTLYSYLIGQEVIDNAPQAGLHQGYHGLVVTTGGDCTAATPAIPAVANLPAGSRELLGQHMRLSDLSVTQTGNLFTIRARVMYGEDDLFIPTIGAAPNWSQEFCAGRAGSQFCSVSDLTTTVERRLL